VRSPSRLAAVLYGASVLVVVADRVTKILAEHRLAGRPPVTVIPHVVSLTYATNSGGAFSLFPGEPWIFFAASAIVCLVIVASSWRVTSLSTALGLGLVLGGAVGNLTDRVIRGPGISGRVVDFIDFHVWPVFNLADSAIVIGVFVIVLAGFRRKA
jgi:signal peptidase II